jgi:uncharacterized repeat protein (TIGR01451 family)
MDTHKDRTPLLRKTDVSLFRVTLAFALLVVLVLTAGDSATAQQTTTQFASGLGTPQGGLVLSGTVVNLATGNPFRHLWTADAVNGLCRLDPDVDTVGLHAVNPASCINTAAGVTFNAGQMTFDPATNTIYVVDSGGKVGIFILHFLPDGDSGHGLIDQVNQSILAATGAGASVTSGCGIAIPQPTSTSLGPDGDLYVGFKRNGNIMRVISPLTNPVPCSNVQPAVIATGDRLTSQMAWVGHTMFLNDSRLPLQVNFADQCFTPQNGNAICSAQSVALIIAAPTTVVSNQTAGQLNGDDVYFGGITLSAITGLTQNPFIGLTGGVPQTNFGGTDASFSNIGALAVDASNPTSDVLYVGDDPTAGSVAASGRWWQVLSAPPPPAPPSAPLNVTATAGDASATVTWLAPVNHQPVTSYTVHTSFSSNGLTVPDVIVNPAPGSSIVPNGTTVTGLTDGVSYQFEVLASNTLGSSPFSAPSNTVTPQAITMPGAPTNVVAVAGNASASVAWTAPSSDGGSAITSYTVTALSGGVATGITARVQAPSTGVVVSGLTNGTAYTFTVHATNAIGSGQESLPSAQVTPSAITVPGTPTGVTAVPGNAQATVSWLAPASNGGSPITSYTVTTQSGGAPIAPVTLGGTSAVIAGLTNGIGYAFTVHATNAIGNSPESLASPVVVPTPPPPDMAVTMSGPSQVIAGNSAVYTINVTNLGPSPAPGVTVTDSEIGATISSVSTSLGTCTTAGSTINCNLGTVASGNGAVISITLKPTSDTINQATVQASAAAGSDPNPANNTASVNTTFVPLASTTDVQVVGSAQNGGPSVTASDTFTWQIKNNQTLAASTLHFSSTLAPQMVLQAVSSNVGTCSSPAAGSAGATFTCDLATLSGGQTMTVTVSVTFNATGTMSTTGQVTFNGTDNNPANNSASITIGVR